MNGPTLPKISPPGDIRHCPRCGGASLKWHSSTNFECCGCGFMLYLNVAAAVAVIIECRGTILFGVRKNDPGKGMLDLPGGFADPGESAEECGRREVREETGIILGPLKVIASYPNTYLYRDVLYNTLDIIMTSTLDDFPTARAGDDLTDLLWIPRDAIDVDNIAFTSLRQAVRFYLGT